MLSASQIFVNADCSTFAVTDAIDNEARTEHTIAPGKNSRRGGHQCLWIDCDQAARRKFHLVFGGKEVETWRMTDRHDDRVALNLAFAVLIERRIEPLVLIENPLRLQGFKSG